MNLGRYSCVGKQLALIEIRTVVAHLISKFDINLAADEDGQSLLQESEDNFTLALGSLKVVFEPRNV